MTNLAKRIVKKSREKIYGDLIASVQRLSSRLDEVQTQNMNEINEVKSKLRNSGILHTNENEIVTKIFSGLKIYLDPRDLAVATHIALDGIWEEPITKAWLSVIQPEDTILDIGANFGYFGLLAAQFTSKKKAKVVLFEANPKIIPYVKKSLETNWFNEQTKVENYAVADKAGKLKLNILKDYIGSSSVQSLEHLNKYMHKKMLLQLSESIEVPAITIDQYCKNQKIKDVNLIKMDIEGFEDKAYAGMRGIIKASPSVTLFIEFTEAAYDDPQSFYKQMLSDFGYVYLIDEDGNLTKPKAMDYQSVIGVADDWVMPVFSKNPSLNAN